MNSKVLLTASFLAVFVIGTWGASSLAFAQYMGNVGQQGQTGAYTLEEALEIQRRRVEAAAANPASGSGTVERNPLAGATFRASHHWHGKDTGPAASRRTAPCR